MPQCRDCLRTFLSQRGLTQHRKTCVSYQSACAERLERISASSSLSEKRPRSTSDLEEAPSARPAPQGPLSELEAPEGQDLLLADNVPSIYEAPCPPAAVESDMPLTAPDIQPPPWPLPNMSTWRLMQWALSGDFHKSESELDRLFKDVFQAPDFDKAELSGFDAEIAFTTLERAQVILPGSNPLTLEHWRQEYQISTREKDKPKVRWNSTEM